MEKTPKAPRKPFILVRYRIEPFGIVKHVWEIMIRPAPEGKGNVQISAKQARRFIEENRLELQLSDEDTSIWGTPDRAFQKRWAGCFAAETARKKRNNDRRAEAKRQGAPRSHTGRPRKGAPATPRAYA